MRVSSMVEIVCQKPPSNNERTKGGVRSSMKTESTVLDEQSLSDSLQSSPTPQSSLMNGMPDHSETTSSAVDSTSSRYQLGEQAKIKKKKKEKDKSQKRKKSKSKSANRKKINEHSISINDDFNGPNGVGTSPDRTPFPTNTSSHVAQDPLQVIDSLGWPQNFDLQPDSTPAGEDDFFAVTPRTDGEIALKRAARSPTTATTNVKVSSLTSPNVSHQLKETSPFAQIRTASLKPSPRSRLRIENNSSLIPPAELKRASMPTTEKKSSVSSFSSELPDGFSVYFDDFVKGVGSRNGSTTGSASKYYRNDLEAQTDYEEDEVSVITWDEQGAGLRDERKYLEKLNGTQGNNNLPMDLLVNYMLAMGADVQTANEVAMSFAAEQMASTRQQPSQLQQQSRRSSECRYSDLSDSKAMLRQDLQGMHHVPRIPQQPPQRELQHYPVETMPDPSIVNAAVDTAVVEALPVNEDNWEVIYADSTPLSLKYLVQERPVKRFVVLACLAVLVVVGVVVYFVGFHHRDSKLAFETTSSTLAPSSAPTLIDDDIFKAAESLSGEAALADTQSPQFRAVSWMSTHDMIATSGFRQLFTQRYVMIVLYYSLEGSEWINRERWLDPTLHECKWSFGIKCEFDAAGFWSITGIDTIRNNCQGVLPPEIGYLSKVETFRLSKNKIGGSLPLSIGFMTSLSVIDLSSNLISGEIPHTINGPRDLTELDLSDNQLNSTIPIEIFDLQFLRQLVLSSNKLSGKLSETMDKLSSLVTLDLRRNALTGTVPITLDGTPTLDIIQLDFNNFTGPLPLITNALVKKQTISVSHNQFEGNVQLSPTFGLEFVADVDNFGFRLQYVDVSYNKLAGPVSSIFGFLPTLRYVDMSGNFFNGTFPSNIGWTVIEHLAMAHNELTGTVPVGLPTLTHLDTSYNQFTGGIPSELCEYSGLDFLLVQNNPLGLTIPECLATLPLRDFEAFDNLLTGNIPEAFGQVFQLEILDLSGNNLEGSIPSALGDVSGIKYLLLGDNMLTSSIPSEIANMKDLHTLNLENNSLSGIVPSIFGELLELENLLLKGNDLLSGEIPQGLCESTNLELQTQYIGCGIACSCCTGTGVCN